ncbi:MAG: acyltransferase [Chloroflexota bacterium]|nr:acyltransferase [Chloroflexota bacterium]
MVVVYLPGRVGNQLRFRYYRTRLRFLGSDVRIDAGAQLVNPEYISIGDNCWIDRYVLLIAGPPHEGNRKLARTENPMFKYTEGELVIGKNCHIASHVVINGHGGVSIGDDSTVAAGAKIVSLSHHYRNVLDPEDRHLYSFGSRVPGHDQFLLSSAVALDQNTALATNSIMLPGSSIGRYSWVGAGSVVTGHIPPGCVAWGIPAKPMKDRPGFREA